MNEAVGIETLKKRLEIERQKEGQKEGRVAVPYSESVNEAIRRYFSHKSSGYIDPFDKDLKDE